jgi:hypothetical protein
MKFAASLHSFVRPRRSHSSIPTCAKFQPPRAAAVKDGPVFGATAPAARSVLDGREHDGSLDRVGDLPIAPIKPSLKKAHKRASQKACSCSQPFKPKYQTGLSQNR